MQEMRGRTGLAQCIVRHNPYLACFLNPTICSTSPEPLSSSTRTYIISLPLLLDVLLGGTLLESSHSPPIEFPFYLIHLVAQETIQHLFFFILSHSKVYVKLAVSHL